MEQAIQHGADIIIRDWVRLRAGERLLIVSSQKYAVEVAAMQQAAQAVGSVADVLMLDDLHEQVGQYFDDREDAFDPYNAVIGAAEYSLITTRAVKRVIARRNRFLSLPLSTSNGQSLLSYDFLNMRLPKSRIMDNASGRRLKQFLARFHDPENMVVAAEFGIGLNTHSRCAGNCYIEDESTYGTFHIGFGRNIALGGVQDASGHYDLVTHAPCIYVDNRMIMDHGQLTVLEPSIYL